MTEKPLGVSPSGFSVETFSYATAAEPYCASWRRR